MSANDNKSACQVAMEAAMDKVIEVCEGEDARDEAMKEAGTMLGLDTEPDMDCDASLTEGLDDATCQDFVGVRQWVMCRVFNSPNGGEPLLDKHDGSFQPAIEEAWEIAKGECENL